MKINQWTLGLAAVGVVSLASVANAEEQMNALQTALSATTISGYVDTSVEWADNDYTGGSFPLPIPFRSGSAFGSNAKSDGFNLNVVKLSLEKAMDESEWASGYKVDLLFGPDAVGYNAVVGSGGDVGIKQAYVALRTPVGNGIDWKVGVFDTIIGYEVFEAGNNPNFSRSWGYAIEPTQHEGVLATYRVNDMIALAAGVANTLTPGIGARDTSNGDASGYWDKTWMGSIAITAPDDAGFLSGSTLYAGIVTGFAGGGENQDNYYIGGTMNTPVTGLKAGAAFDVVSDLFGTDDLDAWTLAGYLSFQASEKLSLHGRAEYGEVDGLGLDGEILSLTGTVQYDLWANVISRLEVRWDDAEESALAIDEDAASVYLNLIYKF
jgi:hypothetical protein